MNWRDIMNAAIGAMIAIVGLEVMKLASYWVCLMIQDHIQARKEDAQRAYASSVVAGVRKQFRKEEGHQMGG